MDSDNIWDKKLIEKYINSSGFADAFELSAVMTELKKSQIIMGCLDTIDGRLMMDTVVDGIKENMMKIVRRSVDGFDENFKEIKHAALQINIAHDFMMGLLTLLDRGEDYKKRVSEEHETLMRKE